MLSIPTKRKINDESIIFEENFENSHIERDMFNIKKNLRILEV